jgi:hypothetical protein
MGESEIPADPQPALNFWTVHWRVFLRGLVAIVT